VSAERAEELLRAVPDEQESDDQSQYQEPKFHS
jgi:hypothetical protein